MFPYSKNLSEWKEKTKNSKTLKRESSTKYCAHSFWRWKKEDGEEYEPATLRSFVFSFDRYLRKEGYSTVIIEGQVFRKTRETLVAKQKEFENSGKRKKDKGSLHSDWRRGRCFLRQRTFGSFVSGVHVKHVVVEQHPALRPKKVSRA